MGRGIFTGLRARYESLSEIRKYDVAFFPGALLTLALPPIGFFPVAFLVFPLLMWMTARARNAHGAFLTGMMFGAGYFVTGLYWLAVGFKGFFGEMPWFLPFIVIIVPLSTAFYWGIASWAAFHFRRHGVFYALAYVAMFFWGEYAHGHDLGRFPWNTLGYSWYHVMPVLQSVSIFGIYGLTFLTLLWSAVPFLLLSPRAGHAGRIAAAVIGLSFLCVVAFGAERMLGAKPSFYEDVAIRTVQPMITSEEKRAISREKEFFERQLRLMKQQPAETSPHVFVIWPESSFDYKVDQPPLERFREISEALPQGGVVIVGVHRILPPDENSRQKSYNSLLAVDKKGNILASYDKHILVPWAEYVPFSDVIKRTFLYKYLMNMAKIKEGSGIKTIHIAGFPSFSPAICFEAAFSGEVVDRKDRPDFILLISDDAWTMGSVGPHQNFSFARVRAIEEGLPIVRAANTGISAVMDPWGRELKRLDLHAMGIIRSPLPRPASPTFYSKHGDAPFLLFMAVFTAALVAAAAGYAARERKKR